jgi:hypothetical protein
MKHEFDEKALMKYTYENVIDLTKTVVLQYIEEGEIKINDDPFISISAALLVVLKDLTKQEKEMSQNIRNELQIKMVECFGKLNFNDENKDNEDTK